MIEDGLVQEISSLLEKGITFDHQSMQGIGYKEFRPYFQGKEELSVCIAEVKRNSRRFAKRQYTFFRNQLEMKWYEDTKQALQEVKQWLI